MKRFFIALSMVLMVVLILASVSAAAYTAPADYGTQREYVKSLLLSAGMKEHQFANGPTGAANEFYNYNEFARLAGFFDNWTFNATATVTEEVKAAMDAAMKPAYDGLYNALHANPPAPYFVHGLAVPIFPYGNSATAKYNDTSGEGIARYVVYVDTNFDSDADGKLDYVKVLVQLPRAAVEQGMKVSTIYEARPYIEGTNGSVHTTTTLQGWGNDWLNLPGNRPFSHDKLHGTAPQRVPTGEATTKQMVANADYRDWYYTYTYNQTNTAATVSYTGTAQNCYENLNWYDYYLVRGFAFVSTAGLGALNSTGLSTYGADIEIDAFKCVIEWLTGDRKAYSDKAGTIEVKADWSNGIIGMTGRSYAGGTQFALATTGVKGLKAIVPVAGTASYYDYQNSGGGLTGSNNYTQGMAWYINSRLGAPDWLTVRGRQAGYIQQMLAEATALNGNYGDHWAHREYTVDGWFQDWGPSKIKTPMLIVHATNDDNVRPKQSVDMYNAALQAGVDVRWIWHQGDHMTPTFPLATPTTAEATTGTMRPHGMYIGTFNLDGKPTEMTYDEVLNLWFSHYLYNVDNKVLDVLPGVIALDNYITPTGNGANAWVGYDSWEPVTSKYMTSAYNIKAASAASSISAFGFDGSIAPEYVEEEAIPPAEGGGGYIAPENYAQEVIAPAAAPAAAPANVVTLNSANSAALSLANLRTPTAGSIIYSLALPQDFTVKGVVEVNIRAAFKTLGTATATDNLRMHVTLAETPRTANTLRYYGNNNSLGTAPDRVMIQQRGALIGGGATSFNLVRFTQVTNGAFRQITKGWFDLCNPKAGFEAYTCAIEDVIVPRNNIGVYHDYTVYLQPVIHTAKSGNQLVALITFGVTSPASTTGTGAYTIDVDLDNTYVKLPSAYSADLVGQSLVTFMDADGTELSSQFVASGQTALAPAGPEKFGYGFAGWFTAAQGGAKWDFATPITDNLQLYAHWTKYDFSVYLAQPKKTGDTITVDLILSGSGLNYTQLAAEINFNSTKLQYLGNEGLKGVIATCVQTAASKISLRSVPSTNMVIGGSCTPAVTIVTLKFKALNNASGTSEFSILPATAVSPPAGYLGAVIGLGGPVYINL